MARVLSSDAIALEVHALTQSEEDTAGVLSALITSRNRFEGWWKGVLFGGFVRKWGRKAGFDAAYPGPHQAGVSMETDVEVHDGRRLFTRRTGRYSKRVDLVVSEGDLGGRTHLLELKLLDGRWRDAAQFNAIWTDILALRALGTWPDVASTWCLVLAYGYASEGALRAELAGGGLFDGAPSSGVYEPITADDQGVVAWVVGIRVS